MRLLVFGHHSHTGFGVVTDNLARRFVAAGVDVRVLAVNHRGEPIEGPLAGRIWPANMFGHSHGGNISAAAIDGSFWDRFGAPWKPDAVLVVADMSGLMAHVGASAGIPPAWQTVPVFHYCPIEGDNLPIGWRGVWERIRPVAMSEYGRGIIANHVGHDVPMIYHGVDTDTFHPVSMANPVTHEGKRLATKEAVKAAFGLDPARKVILRTDRNVLRKFYDRMFAAAPAVLAANPDTDILLHCNPLEQMDTQPLVEEIGRLPREFIPRIKLTNAHDTFRGLSTESLVALMNAADLYWSTTGGEGFGLTLAESLACGVPVVATGWAAEREVVGDGGICVPPLTDTYGEPVRFHSTYGMDWAVPDSRAFVAPITDLLTRSHRRRAMGAAGRLHVARSFSWDAAAASFLSLFEDADARPFDLAG